MENITISKNNQLLQLVASKEEARPNITGVYFNDKHAFSTNGHYLVMAKKAEGEPTNKILKFSSEKQKNKSGMEIYQPVNDKRAVGINGSGLVETIDGEYPDCIRAFPCPDTKPTVTISINAKYLLDLAKVLSDKDRESCITLEIRGETDPIVVKGSTRTDAIGVIMPMRSKAKTTPTEIYRDIL